MVAGVTPRWERFWLGKPAVDQYRPQTRLVLIGVWILFLGLTVGVILAGEHHFLLGGMLTVVTIFGVVNQAVPLAIENRRRKTSHE